MSENSNKYAIDFLDVIIDDEPLTLTYGKSHTTYGTLTEVSFHKEIYQPGCVEFKIQKGTDIDYCKNRVTLKYGTENSYDEIAKSYYIFERKKTKKYLYCKAYSVDKFLTIDKFNYAFTGKCLVSPFITKADKKRINDGKVNPKAVAKAGGIVSTVLSEVKTAAIKKFKELITQPAKDTYYVKNLNQLGTGDEEAVIPYCVQYNESFLDFMVRICNRYGEFLYCENNQWHIGLKKAKSPRTISNVASETKYESCIDIVDGAILLNPNYLDSACADNKTHDATTTSGVKKSNGTFSQEYFEPISNKDYAKLSDYLPPTSTAFDFLKSAAERQNFFDALAGTTIATTMRFAISGKFMNDINTKYLKQYYEKLTDGVVENKDKVVENKAEEVKSNDVDKDQKYEFTRTETKKVDTGFCGNIMKSEEKAEKGKLELEFSTYNHIALGENVVYGSENYVAYIVEGGKGKDGKEWQNMTFVPEQGENTFYPLPKPHLPTQKASPQRAIVVNNFDPMRLGRVRVKYPWQPVTDPVMADATPWLRVSYPMASNQSGFMFFPKSGDEVLIDYEEGDIERPFVNGSFYSATNPPSVPSSTQMVGVVKSITSDNGHHISFTDLSGGYKFISDLIPFVSLLSKFGLLSSPGMGDTAEAMLAWKKDLRKYLAGGFEIGDYLGVYSIKGSTHDRNITISSPVGDVVIDAFTGITINAPHGDVNIVGKNVNIEARNNLTMISGTNIKQPYFWHSGEVGKSAMRFIPVFFGGLAKATGFDLSFHRTWLEVLIRPIGGTMLIKSYRYLCLEAGEGNATFAMSQDETKNSAILNELQTFIGSVETFLTMTITLRKHIEIISSPFNEIDFLYEIDLKILKGIINGEIKDKNHIDENSVNIHKWENYLNKVLHMRHLFHNIKQDAFLKKSKYLKEMIKEYEAEIERLEKELLGMSLDDIGKNVSVEIPTEFDVTTSETCKKILFNSIAEYVKNDTDLCMLCNLDKSKVDNWTTTEGIKKGIVVGPTKEEILKRMWVAPFKNSLSFFGFSDDKWWKKLDDGGIVYSVSKSHYKIIKKGGLQNPQIEEEKVNSGNLSLLQMISDSIAKNVCKSKWDFVVEE